MDSLTAANSKPTLVLGSTSKYRKTVLEKLGIPFVTARPDVDETRNPNESPRDLVRRLAEAKARAAALNFQNALVIGSDQVASLSDEILTKPGNFTNAFRQLSLMSGKEVVFHTGLCLFNTATNEFQIDVVDFSVCLRSLTPAQITNYLERDTPYDSAGSFKSEGLGIALFEKMQGEDPNALIGLPLIRLVTMLTAENFPVF